MNSEDKMSYHAHSNSESQSLRQMPTQLGKRNNFQILNSF